MLEIVVVIIYSGSQSQLRNCFQARILRSIETDNDHENSYNIEFILHQGMVMNLLVPENQQAV